MFSCFDRVDHPRPVELVFEPDFGLCRLHALWRIIGAITAESTGLACRDKVSILQRQHISNSNREQPVLTGICRAQGSRHLYKLYDLWIVRTTPCSRTDPVPETLRP